MSPDGRIVISDPNNNRIVMIDGDSVKILEDSSNVCHHAVTALADGRVCFSCFVGRLCILNPDTLEEIFYNQLPNRIGTWALTCENIGTVYVATTDCSVYRVGVGKIIKVVDNLPFDHITDIDIADDNRIYVAGYEKIEEK